MGRGWKIPLAIVAVLGVLLAANAVAVDNQTKGASATIEGGRILELAGGDLQVFEQGPGGPARQGGRRPRGGAAARPPIVLLHCYACSLHWWERMAPLLARRHRVIRLDLLGFGGSEKPAAGYAMTEQAALVAEALNRLRVEAAVVVGHSMGGTVATALAEQSSELVDRVVIVDSSPDHSYGKLPFTARLGYVPVLGEAIRRITPDFLIRDGYESAFAPGYDVEDGFEDPDRVVEDFRATTYTSYDSAAAAIDDYTDELALPQRITRTAVPLLAIFGAEDQIVDAARSIEAFDTVPGAATAEIPGAGHSPNVERPERTAHLVLEFAAEAGGLEEHPRRSR